MVINQQLILDYLNKNYFIKDGMFFIKFGNKHEWSRDVVLFLAKVYSYDEDECENIIQSWYYAKGLTEKDWDKSWKPILLKTSWNIEMMQDLISLGVSNSERQMIILLKEDLNKEIDVTVLDEFEINNIDEFFGLVKCVGYDVSVAFYDSNIGIPRKHFISMNLTDIEHERQNNTHWQDWIRTRERNQQTQSTSVLEKDGYGVH